MPRWSHRLGIPAVGEDKVREHLSEGLDRKSLQGGTVAHA